MKVLVEVELSRTEGPLAPPDVVADELKSLLHEEELEVVSDGAVGYYNMTANIVRIYN